MTSGLSFHQPGNPSPLMINGPLSHQPDNLCLLSQDVLSVGVNFIQSKAIVALSQIAPFNLNQLAEIL